MNSDDVQDIQLVKWYLEDIGMTNYVAAVWLVDSLSHPRRWRELLVRARERKSKLPTEVI